MEVSHARNGGESSVETVEGGEAQRDQGKDLSKG